MFYLLILVALIFVAIYAIGIIVIHSAMCSQCPLTEECEKARGKNEIPPCKKNLIDNPFADKLK